MTEVQFEEFLARCLSNAQRKNDALDAEYGFLSFARWDDDRDRELLVFSNPGERRVLEAKRTHIGSYSLRTIRAMLSIATKIHKWPAESALNQSR